MTAPNAERLTLVRVVEALGLERLTPELPEDPLQPVTAGYATDLLSDVLAHAPQGGLLITVQVNVNVVAVAVHADQAGIVFAQGRRPDEAVRRRAVEQGVRAYSTPLSAFETVGRLYALGLRGEKE